MGTCRYDKNKIQDAMKMTKIWGSYYISGSQSGVQEPWEIPETISGGPQCQNNDHNNTKTLFAFFTLNLFQGYSGVFSETT